MLYKRVRVQWFNGMGITLCGADLFFYGLSGVSSLMWIDDAFRDRDFHTRRVNPIGNEALDEPRLKLKGNAMVGEQRSFVWPHESRWHQRQLATTEEEKKPFPTLPQLHSYYSYLSPTQLT